ncbi:unnamed protein product [Chrysoparadoxa australica]
MESDGAGKMAMDVDESLYSRQLYVMGHEAQQKLSSSSVLLVGLNGLGVEVAKNLALAGVQSLCLLDDAPVQWSDLSAQFFLCESDLGKPRAAACVGKVAELNRYVKISVATGDASAVMGNFQVVVMIDVPLKDQLAANEFCHSRGICFISADVRGVFGSVFCDFGEEFVVSDKDGNPVSSCLVNSITKGSPAFVTVMDDVRHNLETGDTVVFSSMNGMTELEGQQLTVTVRNPFSFEINCDTTAYSTFVSGYMNQVKLPVTMQFKTLKAALEEPEPFMETDFAKIGRPAVLHQTFRGLAEFRSKHGALPEPGNKAHAEELLALTIALNSASGFKTELPEEAQKVVQQLALCAQGVISPMCAALGGIVGQEALKACSQKFTPIHQWLYFDAAEALPAEPLPAEAVAMRGSRYDGQAAVFGRGMQELLSAAQVFLVGAGAIGCEMLKNWAMMGVGCGDGGGGVHVTDMDHIEKSNLSRQFLFRTTDISKPKSSTAARAAQGMNSQLKITAHELKCAPETEDIFCDGFYEKLSAVCTALDNVDARLYMDQKCLFYRKPMLESGTLGTKGNTQVVVPYLTENYGASRDPPEKSIPVCTLKNFPNQVEHTLQWSRDWFEGVFKQNADDANQYLSDSSFMAQLDAQQNTKLDTLRRVEACLSSARPTSFRECIVWARSEFEEYFHNTVLQLLHNFPADSLTSAGTPFWSGAKRPPTPLEFDASDPLHLDFIKAAANLRAENYGITGTADNATFVATLADVMVAEFAPVDGVKIAVTEAEAKEQGSTGSQSFSGADAEVQCRQLVERLPAPASMAGFRLSPIEFDKDVDAHMEFVTAASNLRARCYRIPEADMHKSRLIAGKIIPAIATTTALVTGLVCLEMYKLLQGKKLEDYKNWFLNLAIPQFACSEPIPPATTTVQVKGKEWKWSAWDCIDLDKGDITLQQLFEFLEQEYNLEVTMLSHGVSILYSFFANKKKVKERMPMTMTQLVESVTKKPVEPSCKYLIFEVCAQDKDSEEELEIPYIRLVR